MRVSVDENDPGYAPMLIGSCKVFFEGSERGRVITADEEKRLIVAYVADEQGRPVLCGDEIKTETLYGHVRLECDSVALENHLGWQFIFRPPPGCQDEVVLVNGWADTDEPPGSGPSPSI